MDSFIKKILTGKTDDESRRYFLRFGKGNYKRRFLISLTKGDKIKVRTSFEFANDLVKFVNELKKLRFSGKILSKEQVPELKGRKKAGVFVYEVIDQILDNLKNVYYHLLDVNDAEINLKIKKALPKPGKDDEKIDEGFCSLIVDSKYLNQLKNAFFWDIPENVKKVEIEHEIKINEIIIPKGEIDPVKIRELAKRKGKIIRTVIIDGKETKKEYDFLA